MSRIVIAEVEAQPGRGVTTYFTLPDDVLRLS